MPDMTQPTSEALSDEELAEIRNRVVPVHSKQTKRLLATLDQALARCEAAEREIQTLRHDLNVSVGTSPGGGACQIAAKEALKKSREAVPLIG